MPQDCLRFFDMSHAHFKYWAKHLSHHLTVPNTTIAENLAISARRYPNRTAVDFYGQRISYHELQGQVDRLAGYLSKECGLAKGDRVLVDMQNSPQFIISYYAILRVGAVVLPINPMNLKDEIAHCLEDSGARIAIVAQEVFPQLEPLISAGQLDRVIVAAYADLLPANTDLPVPDTVRALRREISGAGVSLWSEVLATEHSIEVPEVSSDDLAVLVYTSGTTGRPKGCMLSHYALNAAVALLGNWNSWTADAIALATAPYFHVTGMAASMNLPLFVGASIVLLPRWDRSVAATLIQRHQVSHWTNVPTMVVDLLAMPGIEKCDFSSLCYTGGGGTAMPQAVATQLFNLTGLEYQEGWGLSEVAGAIHLNPVGRAKRQCLGIPTFDVDTRVIDPDTLAPVGVSHVGELVTRGPSLFDGYWKQPEANAQAFIEIDGQRFFRTGDIGYVDEEGYFYMADRLKRMINSSGYKVWPAEVEGILYGCPSIQEVCVIGTHDAHRGETVKAVVVLKESAKESTSADDIVHWSREHMSAYKIPRIVEFVDELPKSGTGKVQWRQLQDLEATA